jgi:5-methylcytosine-specific restriction endonuclease McrBC GTP-binding regulatory subunit McrB
MQLFSRNYIKREEIGMKLIFVYNADSGLLNTLMDIGHKIIKPETYTCNLCNLTFGNFSENRKWKEFRENTDIEMEFLHRDEFETKYEMKLDCPVILKGADPLEIAIPKEQLEEFKSLDQLINAVNELESR